LEKLDLSEAELRGKKILDIGSSRHAKFAREAESKDIEVISLNPELAIEKVGLKRAIKETAEQKGLPGVAALAQELPFPDNTFDLEVSLYGVPGYLPKFVSEYQLAFQEIIRTLKPGGEAKLFPISDKLAGTEEFKSLLAGLSGAEAGLVLEDLPGSSDDQRYRLVIRKKKVD
jgi:ubiquinone/menaquinone biosynthesis C-methylase UbiE